MTGIEEYCTIVQTLSQCLVEITIEWRLVFEEDKCEVEFPGNMFYRNSSCPCHVTSLYCWI